MKEGYLPDSDEFLTVEDALNLIARYRSYFDDLEVVLRYSRDNIALELRDAFEDGTVALQDEESMRLGNPSKHLEATRKRVAAAIKTSPLAAISSTLWISFADFERFADFFFLPYDEIDDLFDGYRFTVYDVQNELGYTIRGAARALAKKYSISERAMGERILEAAEKGTLSVRDPHTGMPYIPKERSDHHERISVSDLNQWLEESGAPYQFDEESLTSTTASAATRRRDIDRNRVMQIFSVDSRVEQNRRFWDDKLSRPPEWLKAARTFTGKAGRSSRWDPLLVAHALLGRYANLPQLDTAIHKHLPDLVEQWKAETADQRYGGEGTDD